MMTLILFKLGVVLFLQADDRKLAFKEFSSSEGKVKLLMPGTPEKKPQEVAGLKVIGFNVHVKDGAYSISYTDLKPDTPRDLSVGIKELADSHDGKIKSKKRWAFEGMTGWEFEIATTKPEGYISSRIIVVKNRLYSILAMGDKAHMNHPEVKKYLNSFKLIK